MEIKYKRTSTFKLVGIFFISLSLVNLLLYIATKFIIFQFVLASIIYLLIGMLHYFVEYRNYIVIRGNMLQITSNMFFVKQIHITSINKMNDEGTKIKILYSNKEKYIYKKFLHTDDMERLQAFFSKKFC